MQEHFPASRITYLLPGQSTVLSGGGRAVEIMATSGATLGPPWQQAENGFVVRPAAVPEDGTETGTRVQSNARYELIRVKKGIEAIQ